MYTRLLLVTAALTTFLALPACSRAGEPSSTQTPRTTSDTSESFLFVLQAAGGTFSPKDGNQRSYTLTLSDPNPTVIFISDRPKRLVGHVPLELFVQGWGIMGFAEQPPDAAAILRDSSANEGSVIVELARPEWNGSVKSLTFQARVVQSDRATGAHFTSRFAEDRLPTSFKHLSLFIDPSRQRAIEFIGTPNGVIELRERYPQPGDHPIDVVPQMSYIGPSYFNNPGAAPSPTPPSGGGASPSK